MEVLKKFTVDASKYDRILNAALHLFKERGYHGTSTASIAKAANISKGLLYHYFTSKEDLLKQIGHKMYDLVYTEFDQDSNGVLTTQEFELFVRSSFKSIRENRDFFAMVFTISTNHEIREIMFKNCEVLRIQHELKILQKYFNDRFANPEKELSLFLAHSKGAAMLFCTETDYYTQDMFVFAENDIINRFRKE